MKIDETDIKILEELYNLKPNEKRTTSNLAKKIFNVEQRWELRKKDNFIRIRLDRLVAENLIIAKKENGKCSYIPNKENMLFGKTKMRIQVNGKSISLNYNKICMLTINGKVIMVEL